MRGIVFALLRDEPFSYSLTRIAKALDYHHTTVMHGIEETKKRKESDSEFREKFESIRRAVHEYLGVAA